MSAQDEREMLLAAAKALVHCEQWRLNAAREVGGAGWGPPPDPQLYSRAVKLAMSAVQAVARNSASSGEG